MQSTKTFKAVLKNNKIGTFTLPDFDLLLIYSNQDCLVLA